LFNFERPITMATTFTATRTWIPQQLDDKSVLPVNGLAQVAGEVSVEDQAVDWLFQRGTGLQGVPADRHCEAGNKPCLTTLTSQVVQQEHAVIQSGIGGVREKTGEAVEKDKRRMEDGGKKSV
jgi:hypothetical protein